MATILLSTIGAAVGGTFGGTVLGLTGAAVGKAVGATVGGLIDQKIMGQGSRVVETGRIEQFRLQGVREGEAIQRVFGRARVAGHLIWSSRFQEEVATSTSGGGKGGGQPKITTQSYSYTVSLALALGEGVITRVGRIWADGQEIPRESVNMTVYRGTDDQLPDPVIAGIEGLDKTPTYRGTAYVVFEDLDLSRFGNRIPQMNFEVFRRAQPETLSLLDPSLAIKGVALIPGTGEYSLATTPVEYPGDFSDGRFANLNSSRGGTDIEGSLRDLGEEMPNVNSVSMVVSWFGDDLRCGSCTLTPRVEQKEADGLPMPWRVNGVGRSQAQQVSMVDDRPVYGGTPADAAVLEAITALQEDGKNVVFYPFILMDIPVANGLPDPYSDAPDQPVNPWRGRITLNQAPGQSGSTDKTPAAEAEVDAFFGTAGPGDFSVASGAISYSGPNEWSYRRFILHYAHLCAMAGGVEAFNIGSELRGLTQIRSGQDIFPVVQHLQQLAADVRLILGSETKIGYAADWSEYFGYQPQDGSGDLYFHLDALWARTEIDYVGIDNYMPISDWRDDLGHADEGYGSVYDLEYLKSQVAGGEGFDWYYPTAVDRDAQNRIEITDGAYDEPWVYRYKDLKSWWSLPHYNRINGERQAAPTGWLPQSKPIRFTEYGCPSVDKGTNQPNVFFDPKSSESALPHYSDGSVDTLMQAQYLRATLEHWADTANNPISEIYFGPMVDMDNSHVWAWDARPWPEFPNQLDVWTDGDNFALGHWVNGRFNEQPLSAIVAEICEISGQENFDVSDLLGITRGTVIQSVQTGRQSLQPLMLTYDFTASEATGDLRFFSKPDRIEYTIAADDIVVLSGNSSLEKTRSPEAELVGRVRVNFWDDLRDYQSGTSEFRLSNDDAGASSTIDLPITMEPEFSYTVASKALIDASVGRDELKIGLPPSVAHISAGDVVKLNDGETDATYRINRIEDFGTRLLEAQRVEQRVYKRKDVSAVGVSSSSLQASRSATVRFLDLPLLSSEQSSAAPYVAATADPWNDGVAIFSSASENGFALNTVLDRRTKFGKTTSGFDRGPVGRWDEATQVYVKVSSGTLESRPRLDVLNGANVAFVGNGDPEGWEVFQYAHADLQPDGGYLLSGLLRGQAGTEQIMPESWPEGSEIVFMDQAIEQISLPDSDRGLERFFRVGPVDRPVSDATYVSQVHSFDLIALRPFAPVHLRALSGVSGISTSWIRRTRIDGDSWQGFDVPLGETTEQYLVRVLANGQVVREATVTQPAWTYLATDIATDGVTGLVDLEVAQISERFGPGSVARVTASV
ncbi:MAG: glycoside hydrolase TIM-barrel-like domain-containing protein [Pseudomonadota bacterium]